MNHTGVQGTGRLAQADKKTSSTADHHIRFPAPPRRLEQSPAEPVPRLERHWGPEGPKKGEPAPEKGFRRAAGVARALLPPRDKGANPSKG